MVFRALYLCLLVSMAQLHMIGAASVADIVGAIISGGDPTAKIAQEKVVRRAVSSSCELWKSKEKVGPYLHAAINARCGCDKGCQMKVEDILRGSKRSRLLGAAAKGGLFQGGFACRAMLVLAQKRSSNKAWRVDTNAHRSIDKACGFNSSEWAETMANASVIAAHEPPRDNMTTSPAGNSFRSTVIVGVLHNGLGNMIFELAFANILAISLEADYASMMIKEVEGPMNTKGFPPNTPGSWTDLMWLLGLPDSDTGAEPASTEPALRGQRVAQDHCDLLVPSKNQYFSHNTSHGKDAVTVLLGERPADLRRSSMADGLGRISSFAHWGDETEANIPGLKAEQLKAAGRKTLCAKTLGYFQDYALFAGMAPLVHAVIGQPIYKRCAASFKPPPPNEVVVHIRLCSGKFHSYNYYNVENYFSHVLPRALDSARLVSGEAAPVVKVISGCDRHKSGAVKELVEHFNATLPAKRRTTAVEDFCYLTRAKSVVVTESTFGWWGAYLAVPHAKEVHFPGEGAMPLPYDLDAGKVFFHDVTKGRFFGKADREGKIVYGANQPGPSKIAYGNSGEKGRLQVQSAKQKKQRGLAKTEVDRKTKPRPV
mmetsp:Transcript_44065/g.99571  ORF Transcript_44065/g.99571 Transcript_44065/m.99571 type:complete len:598 (-) Transcript_44065:123-1916(-)